MAGTPPQSHDPHAVPLASLIELEESLSPPTERSIADFGTWDRDLLVLGFGGKIGPTLAVMTGKAAPGKRVISGTRFSDPSVQREIEAEGIEPIADNLVDGRAMEALPIATSGIYPARKTLGTAGPSAHPEDTTPTPIDEHANAGAGWEGVSQAIVVQKTPHREAW